MAKLYMVGNLEPRTAKHLHALVVSLGREISPHHVVKIAIQTAFCHFFWIYQLYGSRSRIAAVGKRSVANFDTLGIQGIETLVRHNYFVTNLELVGQFATVNRQGNALHRADILCNIVAFFAIATCNSPYKLTIIVFYRN